MQLSPVVLILAFLNAPKEEIWFRSLFFGKSIPLFGNLGANLLAGPLFALAHLNAQYSQFGVAFQVGFLVPGFRIGTILGIFDAANEQHPCAVFGARRS